MAESNSHHDLSPAKSVIVLSLSALFGFVVMGAAGVLMFPSGETGPDPTQPIVSNKGDEVAQILESERPVVATSPYSATPYLYDQFSERRDVLVLVDYYADWCPPCKKIAPHLTRLASKHGDKVVILKVNVDHQRDLVSRAHIGAIPDVRLLYGGKQLERAVGEKPYEFFESWVLKHEDRLPPPAETPLPVRKKEDAIVPMKKGWLPSGVETL